MGGNRLGRVEGQRKGFHHRGPRGKPRRSTKAPLPEYAGNGAFRDRPLGGSRPLVALDSILYRSTIYCVQIIGARYNRGMKKLTLADYQALAEFRYQIREFLHFSERAVEAAGMEKQQYQFMLAIKGMPEGMRPRIRDLANRMQIQHHSAVELINRLEARGYVRRERAQDDRREVLLALTAKGERVLADLALHHHEQLRTAGPKLVQALQRLQVNQARRERRVGTKRSTKAK